MTIWEILTIPTRDNGTVISCVFCCDFRDIALTFSRFYLSFIRHEPDACSDVHMIDVNKVRLSVILGIQMKNLAHLSSPLIINTSTLWTLKKTFACSQGFKHKGSIKNVICLCGRGAVMGISGKKYASGGWLFRDGFDTRLI